MKKNDQNSGELMLDISKLTNRGWTEPMLKKLLGEPGWIASGWGDRCKRAYQAAYVEAIEASSPFRELFIASAKRRKLEDAFVRAVMDRSKELELSGAISAWQKTSDAIRVAKEDEVKKGKRVLVKRKRTPASELVCEVDVETMLCDWGVSIRFMRHKGIDCVYCSENQSMKAEHKTLGTTTEAITTLLPRVLTTLILFGGSVRFASPGLVGKEMFCKMVDELEAQLTKVKEGNMIHAEEAIVSLARDLGLSPEPSPVSHVTWNARCPGTNHGLQLNIERNEFWCGYCKQRGNLKDLQSFADKRKRPRQI